MTSIESHDTLPALPEPAHRGPTGTGDYFDAYTPEQMCAYALAHKLYERDKWAKVLAESCADERSQLWEAGPGGGCSRAITAEADVQRLRIKLGQFAEAMQLIAAAPRADGTYNRDREACRHLALQSLHRTRQDGAGEPG